MNPPIEPIEITHRPFRIGDIMMLVIIAAVMASARRQFYWMLQDTFLLYNGYEVDRNSTMLALVNGSVIWLVFILLRPADRRRLRRAAPGLFVHLAVALVLGLKFVDWLANGLAFLGIWPHPSATSLQRGLLSMLGNELGVSMSIAIAASWGALAIVGRWRPEPSWDDRIGRLLAVAWLVLGPLEPFVKAWRYR
jgi:hypothetical protein